MNPSASIGTSTQQARLTSRLLNVEVRAREAALVVAVEGEVDVSSIDDLRSVVQRALDRSPEKLVLDLTGLDFCDSSGVHLVVQTHRLAAARGISFLVVPPAGVAWRVFELSCISDYVTFAGPEEGVQLS